MPATPRHAVVLIAAVALIATIPTAATARVEGLKQTSNSTFTLLPGEGLVRASARIQLRNTKKPTRTRHRCKGAPRRTCTTTTAYYIDRWATVLTPPDAANTSISGAGVTPVVLGNDASGTGYAVTFPKLKYKKKQAVDVAYELPDNGPASQQRTRVTDAYAHFCWNGEYTDSGTVEAVLPAGWEAITTGAAVNVSETPTETVITVADKKLPGSATLCTDAFHPAAMQRGHTIAPAGQVITYYAWPDDPDWSTELVRIIDEDLPYLERIIGSPMPFATLTIQEVARSNGFGRPADVHANTSRLLMDEDLGDFAAAPLSTLSRTWFDDGSIGDPWLAEGLALWAGLSTTGYECPDPGTYPLEGVPNLHDWHVNDNAGGNPMLPVYQVSAACSIVAEVAKLIGPERMVAVIDSIRTGAPHYGRRGANPRKGWQPADWTDWLDAVDELGLIPAGLTDLGLAERTLTQYGVATPVRLAGRLPARMLYHDTLASMDGTLLPAFVDRMMESWSFENVTSAILEAKRIHEVIATHPTLPEDVRAAFMRAFESATSADALATVEGAVVSWVPPVEPASTDT